MKILIILCLVTVSVLTANSAPRSIELPATATYSNAVSHFQFPPKIADFVRAQINEFDKDGRDIGVGYNDLLDRVAVTIFVYPVGQRAPDNDLEAHFGVCKADILRAHKEAKSIAERTEEISAGGTKRKAKYACYSFTDVFAQERQEVHSELYLFSQGRWFIKFRATYPAGQRTVAESALKTLINDLIWPGK